MKASELRIGNWIISDREYFDKPQLGEIYQISDSTCFFKYLEENVNEMRSISNPTSSLKPIPLTPEWLERFGFDKEDERHFYHAPVGGSKLYINPTNGVVWVTRDKNVFNNPALIEYVHQLQNLYFALTGEELTIKEPVEK